MPQLTVVPEEVEQIDETHVARNEYPAGAIHTRSILPAHRPSVRRWRLGWSLARAAEIDAIRTLYVETGGGAGVFDWQPPREPQPLVCRFVEPIFRTRQINGRTFQSVVVVEEVI